jgi:TonB-dependent receptor
MRTFLITVISVCLSLISFAQKGKIEGKIIDSKTGAALIGVTVTLKGTNEGVATNVEGRYVINANVPKATLVFSYNGVTQEVTDIPVEANKITYQDLALEQKAKTEEAVVIRSTTTARKETAAALIAFQKNTNTVASVISSESIRRSPDKNTGEVLKRTPGASIQEGKFLVVRGLADRYNQAMLNGILLTSTEPDRKTFSFDLIPSQMIDNIIINKAFVPEYPGEWAGGLIQVNTKDIPSKNFFNIQLGTGFNTQTTGKTFYKDAQGGKYDWLGFDDGTRALPPGYTTKSNFDTSSRAAKIEIGKAMRNSWVPEQYNAPLNLNLQLNGGFTGKFMGKKIGGSLGLIYNKSNKYFDAVNRKNILNDNSDIFTIENDFSDSRYVQEISAGAQAGVSMQLNSYNKVSLKSLINVNTANTVTLRTGKDVSRNDSLLMGTEISFKENTFFTVQAIGEHRIIRPVQFKWYGSFNILDGYIPDQRRLLYSRVTDQDQWSAVIANSLSQQSGSRIYQSLNDYIYTAGGDLNYQFNALGRRQNLKGGYMLQIKDRLYDAQLFANYLPTDNPSLRALPASEIFNAENFGTGYDNKFAFDAIKNRNFRYLANTILNAGYIQLDNQVAKNIRVVWGVRVEHYDQLVGSVKKYDPRFTNTKVLDWLPGLNATFKINNKTNIRFSGSQTVVRPELRELSFLNLYDFDLNASVQGKPTLRRTKVLNLDLRYEIYPRGGEVITAGVFYKHFKDPIEQIYNEGGGGASTFSFQNPEKARSYGVELEFRKKLDAINVLKHFTVQANASYINSRVTDTLFDIDRRLQGQSPYLVNAGLLYDLDNGFNATLLFNVIGERIYLVGDKSAGAGTPDIYEAPRPLLDLQVSQKLLKKKGEIRLNVSDILNRTQYFYQNSDPEKNIQFQKNEDAYRFTRKFGTTFSLSFNYSF